MNPHTDIAESNPSDSLYLEAIALLQSWQQEAARHEELAEAAALATVGKDGDPDVRMVLIKAIDPAGLVFFTNRNSRKGQDLAFQPRCALVFHWKSLHRQVRVSGTTCSLNAEESDRYFASRPRLSQLAAWASEQSQPLAGRRLLEQRLETYEQHFAGQAVSRPPHWVGYRIVPHRLEFWQEEPGRLHRRQLYYNEQVDHHQSAHPNQEKAGWASILLQP